MAQPADEDGTQEGRAAAAGQPRPAGPRRARAGTAARRTVEAASRTARTVKPAKPAKAAKPLKAVKPAKPVAKPAKRAAAEPAEPARAPKPTRKAAVQRAVKTVGAVKAAKKAAKKPVPKPAPLLRTTDRLVLPPHPTLHIPDTKVALSTASVYPESTAVAFELAEKLGYDGVEVMVWNDPVSQDIEALRRLSDAHRMPILAVHAPCLLITQRVWTTDPWTKLVRARAAAEKLGASAVVVHPPFRWQRQYAREFVEGIGRMAGETDVRFAVENMYPWRYRDREVLAYAPGWDVTEEEYRHFTIDLSHASTSRIDALEMVGRMGDRLAHIHLADGSGSGKDEHLIPGRGSQPCAALLEHLARTGFDGHVVLEVNTRRSASPAEREADLAEALAFTRLHLATPARVR